MIATRTPDESGLTHLGLAEELRDPRSCTGTFFLDEEVLAQEGLTDLDGHHAVPGSARLDTDLFLDPHEDDA